MEKILFVCTGNTCRSPMAEIILKAKLKGAGISDIKVGSAGLAVSEFENKISKNSAKAVRKLGYKFSSFKSKQLTPAMIKKATVVITMTAEQSRYLKEFNNVCTMASIGGKDISDPYGMDENAYLQTAKQIEAVCEEIKNKLIKLKGEGL